MDDQRETVRQERERIESIERYGKFETVPAFRCESCGQIRCTKSLEPTSATTAICRGCTLADEAIERERADR